MKKGYCRICMALVLALAMIFTTNIMAFAAEDQTSTVTVEPTAENPSLSPEYGDITTESGNGMDVYVEESFYSATVKAGKISAKAKGLYARNEGTTAVTTGTINAGDEGMYILGWGKTTDIVTGDITSTNTAVYASVYDETSITTGDIKSNNGGIDANVLDKDGNLTVTTGELSVGASSEGSIGVEIYNDFGGSAKITTKGITWNVDDYDIGVIAEAESGGVTDVTVDGDIKANYDCVRAGAYDDGSSTRITVNGDVTAEYGDGIDIFAEDSGTSTSVIDGDITAGSMGIYAGAEEGGSIDALVTGTIEGGDYGVTLDTYFDKTDKDNFALTVWKIVPDDDGVVAVDHYKNIAPSSVDYVSSKSAGDYSEDEEFEEAIKYIIKSEQPSAGGTLTLTDAEGNVLDSSHGYPVANEGDTIVLNVATESGYKVVAAYNDGTEITTKDSSGNFIYQVPRGAA